MSTDTAFLSVDNVSGLLRRLNRELRTIRRCNQILMRATDEQALLNEICQIVCREMHHRLAWVGYVDDDAPRTVRPKASAGEESGYLSSLNITLDDEVRGRGPVGLVLVTGTITYIHDCRTDPRFVPWREAALARHFHSIIALPLKDGGEKVFGVFAIYSAEFNAFTTEEIRLLEELANDLSFGITAIRTRQAREREEKRANQLAAIVESSEDAVIGTTLDGIVTSWNKAAVRMYGYPEEEILGKSISVAVPAYRRSEVDHVLRAISSGEIVRRVETLENRQTGKIINASFVGSCVRDAKGNPIGTSTIVRDISELKQLELMQHVVYEISQASFKAANTEELCRSVHDLIKKVMPAKNFCFSFYDEKQERLSFPYYVDERGGDAPKPRKRGNGAHEEVLVTGKPMLREGTLLNPSTGPIGPAVSTREASVWLGIPLREGERTVGVMALWDYSNAAAYGERDLRMLEYVSSQVVLAIQRKLTEDRLRQNEEQFRLITENAEDMITILDTSGRRVYASPSVKRILGASEDLVGATPFSEVHPEDRERVQRIFAEALAAGVSKRLEFRYISRDGSVRDIECLGTPSRGKDGTVSHAILVSRDITDKKRLELKFLRAQRMESIGTLAAGVAHDLNNVLTPILMSIHLIRKRVTDDVTRNVLDLMETSASRGKEIVSQVLAFGRGASGEHIPLQPKHIVKEILAIAAETFPKTIEIRNQIPHDLGGVLADPTQLHQALLNICVNARDAMPNGGRLEISGENVTLDANYARMTLDAQPGQYVAITISDTGVGVSPDIRDRIFEPFFTTKEFGKGTGLGLSTTAAIVKSHHGFVTIDSEVGRGTTMKVFLPLHSDVPSGPVAGQGPPLPGGAGEMVLIIDDEEGVREVMKETLEACDYKAIVAKHGAEGVALFAEHKGEIKAVLTDIYMPVMDGHATIRALRTLDPDVAIIATSGIPDGIRQLSSGNVGAQAFLVKPFTAEKLLTTLHVLLGKGDHAEPIQAAVDPRQD